MVKAVIVAGSLVALASALPAQKREAEPQIIADLISGGSDVVSDAASYGADFVGSGIDAAKDTAEGVWDAATGLLAIPAGILGLGDYGYDDKVKREAEPQIIADLVSGTADTVGNVASLGGDIFSSGVDAAKDTAESLFGAATDILSIPAGLLGLGYGGYGYGDDKKAKRQILSSIANNVADIVDDVTGNRWDNRPYYGGFRPYRGWRGPRYGRPNWYRGYGWDNDDDDDDYKKKSKRTIVPDILGGVTDVVDTLFGGDDSDYGYGYDDYKKRQILGDVVGTVGDVVDSLFGGDDSDYGYGYDDYKKRTIPDIFGADVDADFDEDVAVDVEDLEKRQILSGLLSSLFNPFGFGAEEADDDKPEAPELPELDEVDVEVEPLVDAFPLPAPPAAVPVAAAPAFQTTA